MMIKKECIGQVFFKKAKNGCHFTGTISENPENFELYKILELDVFEAHVPPKAEIIESEEEVKPKKKKGSK